MLFEITIVLSVQLCCTVLVMYYWYNDIYTKFQSILMPVPLKNTPQVQDPVLLSVQSGEIPSWLNGIMYRVGPGTFNIEQNDGSTFSIRHALDGLPFMHRFEINGQTQQLKYNSRLLAKSIEDAIKDKSFKGLLFLGHVVSGLSFVQWIHHFIHRVVNNLIPFLNPDYDHGSDGQLVGVTASPNFPLPQKYKKNDNEHVLVSKTDSNYLQKIHAETLEPESVFTYTNFDSRLKGQLSAAHHQWDPNTKEIFNFTLTIISPLPRLVVFSTAESGETTVLADFSRRFDGSLFQAPYIHSFWLTENYVIIPESPFTLRDKGMNLIMNGSVLSSLSWKENAPTYLHIIGRHAKNRGLVASIPVPGFFAFHTGNAYESVCPQTGDTLINLEAASFTSGDVIHQLHSFNVPHEKGPYTPPAKTSKINGIAYPTHHQTSFGDLTRYTLNLDRGSAQSVDVLMRNIEFLRFNQKYSMMPESKFVYGCQLHSFTEKKDESIVMVKVDLKDNSVKTFGGEGDLYSEPIFVPKPGSEREDEGVLLSLVNAQECCYFVVVDAVEMKELSRIRIGEFTAVTLHGSYVDHEFESINVN